MEHFKKLMAKKMAEGKTMSPSHMKAKGSVLHDLMGELGKMGADHLQGMKKVTVASDSKEGLQHGLKSAANLVDKGPLHAITHDSMGDSGNEPDQQDGDEASENHNPDMDPAHEATEGADTEAAEQIGRTGDEGEHESTSTHDGVEPLKSRIAELEAELAKHKKSSRFMS
jgi:hypothetical protein